jgi:precorrin-2 methylase
MFNQIFASVPTIYYPLKETVPQIENNIIKVIVKNEIQKEHFETKTREVLEYLRTHFDEKIEDIQVETNEKIKKKKIIYDVKDKLQNFKEQNEEFEDFLHILELKIKD